MDFEDTLRALGTPTAFLAFTLGLMTLVFAFEFWKPARRTATSLRRWSTHGGLSLINTLLGSELGQAVVVGVLAAQIPVNHFLVDRLQTAPFTVMLVSVLVLDLAIYLLHLLMHRNGLWQVHRLHHSDRTFDVTTSVRVHPLENALATVWRLAWVIALGVPYLALLLYALLATAASVFTHANLQLPQRLSTALGWVFITPDLHRIHHSLETSDGGHNFGTVFSFWDRLFGTHRARSLQDTRVPRTGVADISAEQTRSLWQALWLPFARTDSETPLSPSPRLKRSTTS